MLLDFLIFKHVTKLSVTAVNKHECMVHSNYQLPFNKFTTTVGSHIRLQNMYRGRDFRLVSFLKKFPYICFENYILLSVCSLVVRLTSDRPLFRKYDSLYCIGIVPSAHFSDRSIPRPGPFPNPTKQPISQDSSLQPCLPRQYVPL